MSIKRTIISTVVALALVVTVAPGVAQGVTVDELMAQINALTAQLSGLQGASTTSGNVPAACAGITITRTLVKGSTGSDVKCVQALLNTDAATRVAATGIGSAGNETTTYGSLTVAAVKKFQAKYGTGTLGTTGPNTRAKMNAMLAGGTTTTVPPVVTPSTGGLSVAVAYDTPAAVGVATGASAKFTKLNLTAGTGNVSISRLYVMRSGLSANTDVLNIKVVDAATGAYVGNIGSLNSDNKAIISFYPALAINAGTTRSFYLQANVYGSASAGRTMVLGVNSAADIVSNATSVAGSFPVNGNPMSVVSLTIGTVTVSEDGSVTNVAPNVGETDVVLNQFKINANSTEDATVETITAKRTGTATVTDTANIKLWDVTNNRLVSTVASWDSYDHAVFSNLNLVIGKGKTVRYKITADIVNGAGSSKTVNADIIDSDVLVSVKGNTYGYYIAPTEGTWSTSGTGASGTGAADQVIANGSLTISKSASTPATGKISAGSDIVLGKFDFDAKGEDIKITAMKVTATTAVHGWSDTDIKSIAVYDAAGSLVAGPKDPTSLAAAFTDTFIVPVGVHTYTVKATIADSVATSDTVRINIDLSSAANLLATGMLSNNAIVEAPVSLVSANTMTVSGVGLTVTTLASPASKSVPKGTSDYVWATFSLDAGSAGEDIRVSSIIVTDSLGTNAAAADIDNAELWADLTSANSSRGDIYETIITATKQPSATTTTFTMTPTLTVPKGTFVKVALVADLASGAGSGSHSFSIASGLSANGAVTGNALVDTTSITYVTTSTQSMFATTGGTLTVTADTNTPIADIVLGGTSNVTLSMFKLAASNVEDLDLDEISFVASNGTAASTLYFYNGSTLLGSIPGANTGTVIFNDGTLTIPANGNKIITVKADVYPVDGTTVTNGLALRVILQGLNNVKTTGLLSGQTANSSALALGNSMAIYKVKPTFAKNSSSPSGQLVPLANQEVARFDITASAGGDISFIGGTNFLKLYVSASINDTTQSQMTFTLKDSTGTTLDTDIQAAASNTTKAMATTVTFPFAGSNLTVSAGTTKTIYVYSNLSDFEDTGDSMQVYWSAADTTVSSFGIDGAGAYTEGAKIFRNNIMANTMSRTN